MHKHGYTLISQYQIALLQQLIMIYYINSSHMCTQTRGIKVEMYTFTSASRSSCKSTVHTYNLIRKSEKRERQENLRKWRDSRVEQTKCREGEKEKAGLGGGTPREGSPSRRRSPPPLAPVDLGLRRRTGHGETGERGAQQPGPERERGEGLDEKGGARSIPGRRRRRLLGELGSTSSARPSRAKGASSEQVRRDFPCVSVQISDFQFQAPIHTSKHSVKLPFSVCF